MNQNQKSRSKLLSLLELMRPRQWSKNLVLFAALLFSGAFTKVVADLKVLQGFVCFLLLSSSVYVLNDAVDAASDRSHPIKRFRPVASGRVSVPFAVAFSLSLAMAGVLLSFGLGWAFVGVALCYLVSTTAYSLWLKHSVILDVFLIAFGFVLRAVAGGLAIEARISEWLLLCTTLLALFLALAKRRHELVLLQGKAKSHRRILEEYSPLLLDQMMAAVAGSIIVTYALYTFFGAKPYHLSSGQDYPLMMLTIPFVLYGILRYFYLVHQKGQGGSPESVLLNDRSMAVAILLWGMTCCGILLLER